VIVLVVSAFLAAGILVGRWWFVAVPLVLWPLWYLGIELTRGLGDAWWIGFLVVTAASVSLAALGVFVRRQGFGYRRPRSGLSA
jgi:hypothetical protein